VGRGEDGRGREERKGKGGVRACPPTRNFWLRHCRYTLPHFTLVALEMCVYILDGVVGKISFPHSAVFLCASLTTAREEHYD